MAITRHSPVINYISSLYAEEDSLLQTIRTELDQKRLGMQLSPAEGRLLQILLKLINAKKVLEIGMLVGYSAIWIARALPADGMLISLEKSLDNFNEATKNIKTAGLQDKVELIHGEARDILSQMLDKHSGNFDAVFIDADKESYPLYLEMAYKLLRNGGLIIADNTLLFNMVLEESRPVTGGEMWEAMRKFNKLLADTTRFEAVMIPSTDGLSVGIKIGL